MFATLRKDDMDPFPDSKSFEEIKSELVEIVKRIDYLEMRISLDLRNLKSLPLRKFIKRIRLSREISRLRSEIVDVSRSGIDLAGKAFRILIIDSVEGSPRDE